MMIRSLFLTSLLVLLFQPMTVEAIYVKGCKSVYPFKYFIIQNNTDTSSGEIIMSTETNILWCLYKPQKGADTPVFSMEESLTGLSYIGFDKSVMHERIQLTIEDSQGTFYHYYFPLSSLIDDKHKGIVEYAGARIQVIVPFTLEASHNQDITHISAQLTGSVYLNMYYGPTDEVPLTSGCEPFGC